MVGHFALTDIRSIKGLVKLTELVILLLMNSDIVETNKKVRLGGLTFTLVWACYNALKFVLNFM